RILPFLRARPGEALPRQARCPHHASGADEPGRGNCLHNCGSLAKPHPGAGRDGRSRPHGRAPGARPQPSEPMSWPMRAPTSQQAGKPTVFINARLIDPASGRDEPGGVLVADGKIVDLGSHLRRNAPEGAEVSDCDGHGLAPGLIDMQVFTGEPGAEHRETLKTASLAAAAGGVTTIVVMPDTNPVIDQVALVDFIQRRARDNAVVN